MRALVYHYDMTNRELVAEFCFRPDPEKVAAAWAEGKYELAYEIQVADELSDAAKLETAFAVTQDTGRRRSTSVGDVVILGEGQAIQAYVVSGVGFKPVTL